MESSAALALQDGAFRHLWSLYSWIATPCLQSFWLKGCFPSDSSFQITTIDHGGLGQHTWTWQVVARHDQPNMAQNKNQWFWLSTYGGDCWVAMVFVPIIWKLQHHNAMDRELFHETLTTWYQQLDFRYCWVLWEACSLTPITITHTRMNREFGDGNNGGKQTWYRIVDAKSWVTLTK